MSLESAELAQPKLTLGQLASAKVGGGRGIRTPDTLSGTTVFKTAAINRSAIPPQLGLS